MSFGRGVEMEIHDIVNNISVAIGFTASAIIVWGVLVAVVKLLKAEATGEKDGSSIKRRGEIRQELGSYLLLGLEVLIAADVIETIANPVLSEMAILASIVFIRTFIGYFLEREIQGE